MHSLMNLINDHEALHKMAHDILALTCGKPDPAAGYEMLTTFGKRLEAHFLDDADFLYDDPTCTRPTSLDDAVRKVESAFAELKTRWRTYRTQWSADNIAQDWEGFAQDSAAIMHRILDRIAQENAVLYPLALQHSRIRLRAA
ncbi:hypothetical protein [Sphingobium subterraneum]|uniref:Hemerythrin-like domain-containing protein n=1 Tax=Sphingobium subterraneum TaxID=627688 RepID=A0A841IXW4_9SPHN|nr:hypothetical protein [Sphingobium subterraneum]MBB6123503.1 hypothetical protein [Sphingobium subterraneum]